MSDAASVARMKALAQYFRNGGRSSGEMEEHPERSKGDLTDAGKAGMQASQYVPQWGLHDASAPEAQGMGAGTIDEVNAARLRMLQQNNLANQPEAPQQDAADYQAWTGPRQFDQIKQRMQPAAPPPNIRDSLSGPVEMTPELEKQLGYGAKDDEDEENK